MLSRVLFLSMALCFAVSGACAGDACDKTTQQYKDCVRQVDSLRPDKAGQMRVFAADGSEFTAGQVQWMKGQLRKFEKLCARGAPGDDAEASKTLAGVADLLKSHRRSS